MRAEDEAEFATFVAGVSTRVLRTAYAVCGDRQMAEDAVQSALVSAYRSWGRVRDASSSEAYLRKMVLNELLGWRRRKSWGVESPLGRMTEPSQASHENEVVEHQLVWSVVSNLPPRQRAVIALRYYEGLSEAEIAETLGVRAGTVKSHAAAAMARLRALLADSDATAPAGHASAGSARKEAR